MTEGTRTMLTTWLGLLLGVGYIVIGIVGLIAGVADGGDLAFWLVLLCGGGLMILAGVFRVTTPAWLSVALVTIGALAGALATFWSVIVPILAVVLIVLVVLRARTPATA